jgi:hypothetical protein
VTLFLNAGIPMALVNKLVAQAVSEAGLGGGGYSCSVCKAKKFSYNGICDNCKNKRLEMLKE